MWGPTGAVVLVAVVGAVQEAVTPLTVQHTGLTIRAASPINAEQRPPSGWAQRKRVYMTSSFLIRTTWPKKKKIQKKKS